MQHHGTRILPQTHRQHNYTGEGLSHLLSHLGVPPANALACGDAENDVEMLRLVGLGVAMGNANQKAIDACDVRTASCAESGVAAAVERWVLQLPQEE